MMRLIALLPLLLTFRVTGFVQRGAVEIDFLYAIHFMVNLSIPPGDVASAELTITPDGSSPVVIPVDVSTIIPVNDGKESYLRYDWPTEADTPLKLFGKVDYVWSFTASDGSTGTMSDSFVYQDPRAEWVRSLDATGDFSVTAARPLASLTQPLRQVHALLGQNTGRTLHYNLMLYDQPSGCGFTSLRQVASSSVCLSLYSGYQVLERPVGRNAEEFVVGALVRDAYTPLWIGKEVPAWFVSGLAQFYAPTPKNALLPPVQAASRTNTLLNLNEMRAEQDSVLWRAQSYGMVLYIANQIGAQGLFDLARVDADSFGASYEAAVGTPLSALIPAWRQWIFTRDAESVYGITPYQPPTSTPSPTLTFTPTYTLTPLPTLTPTDTSTPTRTPLGVRTYVPPPTVTPAPTDTPPPPTVTPRAPGSLPTVTPPPTALQETMAQPAFQAGAGTFLVLVLLLLLFLLVRLGKRQ